jgi:hypothetical protein
MKLHSMLKQVARATFKGLIELKFEGLEGNIIKTKHVWFILLINNGYVLAWLKNQIWLKLLFRFYTTLFNKRNY